MPAQTERSEVQGWIHFYQGQGPILTSDGRGCGEHTQPVVTAAVAVEDVLDAMD